MITTNSFLVNFFFFLTVDPIKVTQHPESKSVATGASTTLTVEASGDDLQFKWQKNRKTDLSDDEKYCGANTDTLHIVEVEKGDKGRYRCRVSNYMGETFSEEAFRKLVIDVVMCFAYLLCS